MWSLAKTPYLLWHLWRLQINQYNQLAREFIWKGKKPKILLKILQGIKQDGGLGLCDLKIRDAVLKIQWIFKLDQALSMKQLVYLDMNNIMGDLICQINLDIKDISTLTFLQDSFWVKVLKLWCTYNFTIPISKVQVLDQVIWFNSYIKVASKPLFYREWIDKGILKMHHSLSDNSEWLSAHQLSSKFNLAINFVMVMGIIDAIPNRWKFWLKESYKGPKPINFYAI